MHSQILLSLLFGDKLNSDGIEFGLDGGLNWSDISGLETSDKLTSFNIGFYLNLRLKSQWHLSTGILAKSNLGVDKLTSNELNFLGIIPYEENGTYSQKINYFIAPALIKYVFKNRIHVELGPQFGIKYRAWVEFNSETDKKEINIKEFNKDRINFFDSGIAIGSGYKLMAENGITLGIRYYLGLTNVYRGFKNTRNNSIFLKVNIPMGGGKN